MNTLLYLWQFPQQILGYICSKIWITCLELTDIRKVYAHNNQLRIYIVSEASHRRHKLLSLVSGFSLGSHICLTDWHDTADIHHEIGHSIQSLYLGPLYLLIIGIPSAIFNNLWDRWFHRHWTIPQRIRWYYSRFPENWADTLGGVDRRLR